MHHLQHVSESSDKVDSIQGMKSLELAMGALELLLNLIDHRIQTLGSSVLRNLRGFPSHWNLVASQLSRRGFCKCDLSKKTGIQAGLRVCLDVPLVASTSFHSLDNRERWLSFVGNGKFKCSLLLSLHFLYLK